MRDEMISIEIETETDPPPFSALIEQEVIDLTVVKVQ